MFWNCDDQCKDCISTKLLSGPQPYPPPNRESGRGQGRAKVVSCHSFRSAWRNTAEQWLSVSICSHFLPKMLCDDASSKIKDTASQPIQGSGYSCMISYFMSLLQTVQKHLSCPTVWTKFYLLVFKSETSAASESSYTPIGLKWESRWAEMDWLITQIWGMSASEWQTKYLTLMTVVYSPYSHQPREQE